MTLAELITRLERQDGALAIYATPPWSKDAEVVVVREPEDGSRPEIANGKTFLTTVGQARRAMDARRLLRRGCALTADELAGAVIYYAIYDESEPLASLESAEHSLAAMV